MPASYVTGFRSAVAHSEPRFTLAYGTEGKLRSRLLAATQDGTDYEVHEIDGQDDVWTELYTLPTRQSKTKQVILHNADLVDSWQPLKIWLDTCKPMRLVAETKDSSLAVKLAPVVKTRGLMVDCNSPEVSGRIKMAKLIGDWFGISQSQCYSLMEKTEWQLSMGIGFLEKLALLQLSFNLSHLDFFGVPGLAEIKFVKALTAQKKGEALMVALSSQTMNVHAIIQSLEDNLSLLSRLKSALTGMKNISVLATETGMDRTTVKEWIPLARKYDFRSLIRASLALANADRDWAAGNRVGVLEILVNAW